MPDQATKRRVTQMHMDAIANDSGPCYGVRLIDVLPLGGGSMNQAMPSKRDLEAVRKISERTVAGYEVLLDHYRDRVAEVERLRGLIQNVIAGKWSVTELQESIRDV